MTLAERPPWDLVGEIQRRVADSFAGSGPAMREEERRGAATARVPRRMLPSAVLLGLRAGSRPSRRCIAPMRSSSVGQTLY